ncbi:MAG: hypothetical protein QOK25_664 [Thermoleophilaceae bacterium]|nr:hypothetical protein [Thermoleophilaceae bacterium]
MSTPPPAGRGAGPAAQHLPGPDTFLTGEKGSPGGPRRQRMRRAQDRVLDARVALSRAGARLDRVAAQMPVREVLVVSAYRPGGSRLTGALEELAGTRHSLRVALGSMGEPDPALADRTLASGLRGGKFENLNQVLSAAAGGPVADWTLVVDDDVTLPRRFLDRFLAVCERLDLSLAQPAQTLASFAAWPVTRRRAGVLARETRFVEIGPVTCFRRDAASELTPFAPLRYGWGLDLHWAALAAERGWRLGIVDALPARHEHAAVAASYSSRDATEEARRFLADHPFVDRRRAQETVRTHALSAPLP